MLSICRMLGVVVLGVLALVAMPGAALAHLTSYSVANSTLRAQGDKVILEMEGSSAYATQASDEQGQRTEVEAYVAQRLTVAQAGKPCSFAIERYVNLGSIRPVIYGSYACPAPVKSLDELEIHSAVFLEFADDFTHFMRVEIGAAPVGLIFSEVKQDFPQTVNAQVIPERPANVAEQAASENVWVVIRQFIAMGMVHIWTGYDHILFLVTVVLLVRKWKDLLLLVSMFTVAHSITLLLAGFGIVTLPAKLVETLIALSIVVMAARDGWVLWRGKKLRWADGARLIAVGLFGLIHGLGFAGSLMEAHVPKDYFVPALLSFNVGIELGQLVILAVLVPLLLLVDRLRWRRPILLGISLGIMVLAVVWTVQRLIG